MTIVVVHQHDGCCLRDGDTCDDVTAAAFVATAAEGSVRPPVSGVQGQMCRRDMYTDEGRGIAEVRVVSWSLRVVYTEVC